MTDATPSTLHVGQSLRRQEDIKFVTGNGHYVEDIKQPGMLYLAILRSPHAHALTTGREPFRCLGRRWRASRSRGWRSLRQDRQHQAELVVPGTVVPDRAVMAVDRVRFVGECVALIVAETREAAYDALERIDVSYEAVDCGH